VTTARADRMMLNDQEITPELVMSASSKCFASFADILQRVLILLADVALIMWAMMALVQDFRRQCDESLKTYAFMCVALSFVDLIAEIIRCSWDAALDRLQQDFTPGASPNLAGGCGEDGLLEGGGTMGSPVEKGQGGSRAGGSISAGVLGMGVKKEKAIRRKRARELHFWSLVFTASVSIIFSFFSAHDEECEEKVPHLYSYIHAFTYVYIFRLGVIIIWGCCRTVKNYEDAAKFAGGIVPPAQQQQMAVMS